MQDANKTKAQLLVELNALRQRNAELEAIAQQNPRHEEILRIDRETTAPKPSERVFKQAYDTLGRRSQVRAAELERLSRLLLTEVREREQAEASLGTSGSHQRQLAVEQAVLAEIGRIISASPDVDDVYEQLAVAVRKLLPCDRMTISLVDSASNTITNSYTAGTDIPTRRTRDIIPLAGTMTEATLNLPQGCLFHPQHEIEVSQQFPGLLPLYRGGLRSFLAVPLIAQDQTIGVLQIQTHLPNLYTDHCLELAASISTQVAGAIAIAELYRERQQAERALRESEEHFKGLFENSPSAIVLKDKNGCFRLVNKRFEEWYGRTEKDVVGKTSHEIFPQEYADRYVAQDQDVLQRQTVVEQEVTVPFPDGSVHQLLVTKYPVFDTNGSPVGVGTINTDITERKQADEALRASEELNRRIVEAVPGGIAQVSQDGQIVRVNAEAQRFLGLGYDELTKYVVADFAQQTFWEDGSPCEVQDYPVSKCLATRQPQTAAPIGVRRPDGSIAWALFTAIPLADPATGEATGAVVTFLDITERKRAEEERQQLEDQLQQVKKMEAIGTLAGGIAHEFNNILSAILGFADLAQRDLMPQSGAWSDLQEVLKAGNRAKDLVQQILTFSRPNDYQQEPVQLSAVIQEVFVLLRALLPTTIEIRHQIAAGTGAVWANTSQIHQVLMNLCTNAEYAMRETGGLLEVCLDTIEIDYDFAAYHRDLQPGTYVRLCLRDTGPGIPPEIAGRIFDPFFTTKDVGEGTGMGLAIVHGIITNCGGVITVDSTPGEGTAFMIYLPQISRHAATAGKRPDTVIPQGEGRILFVDDEDVLVRLGRAMLERLGYDVDAYTSGVQALAAFQKMPDRFDMVITDQTMPTMTGAMLFKELRRIRPDIPIILCTGFSYMMNAEKAHALGADAFIMKPITMQEMAVTVRQVLEKRAAKGR